MTFARTPQAEKSELGLRYLREKNYVSFVDPYLIRPVPPSSFIKLADPGDTETIPFYTIERIWTIVTSEHYHHTMQFSPEKYALAAQEVSPGSYSIFYSIKDEDFLILVKQKSDKLEYPILLRQVFASNKIKNYRPGANPWITTTSSAEVHELFLKLGLLDLPLPESSTTHTAASAANITDSSYNSTAVISPPPTQETTSPHAATSALPTTPLSPKNRRSAKYWFQVWLKEPNEHPDQGNQPSGSLPQLQSK